MGRNPNHIIDLKAMRIISDRLTEEEGADVGISPGLRRASWELVD